MCDWYRVAGPIILTPCPYDPIPCRRYVHADYVTAQMKARAPGAKVVALADAMFSLHHDAYPANPLNYYTRQFTWGYTAWNSSRSINQKCLAAHNPTHDPTADDAWVCFHGAVAALYVDTPLFIANSKHDTWQARGVLSLNVTECPGTVDGTGHITYCHSTPAEAVAQGKFWVAYGEAMSAAALQLDKRHAAYLTNCPHHCQTGGPGWRQPAFPGTRLDVAVKQWYPAALAHIGNSTWSAPRWIAGVDDECVTPPQ